MKSKITIDVDHDNQPVIKIEYLPSEDVRDKLVKKFLETFGELSWAQFSYLQYEAPGKNAVIRPITFDRLIEESKNMILASKIYEESNQSPKIS